MSDRMPSPELSVPRDSDEVLLWSGCGVEAALYSRVAPGKDTPNEDSAGIIPVAGDSVVLAVADGCGGMRGGSQASALAIESLAEAILNDTSDSGGSRSQILDGFELANARILDLAIGAATTIAAVSFHGGSIRPFHVGDSMILVVGRNGRIKLETVSHSPVGLAVESGLMNEEEAIHHPDRHIVSNVLGDPEMRIEIGPTLPLAQNDTVVIASDGLFDNLLLEEVVDRIRKGSLREGLATLVTAARERMVAPVSDAPRKPDDLTAIAFRQSVPRTRQTLTDS